MTAAKCGCTWPRQTPGGQPCCGILARREAHGEIEAGLAVSLPQLLEIDDLRGDMHCHTNWTDGVNTLEDMATAARARGYEYMALTDHSRSLTITNGLSLERLEEARRLVQHVNQQPAP